MSAPTSFSVTSVSGTSVTFSWANNAVTVTSDAANCSPGSRVSNRIEKSPNGTDSWTTVATATATATGGTYTVPEGTWWFRVVSVERGWVFFSTCTSFDQDYPSSADGSYLIGNDTTPDAFTFTDKTSQALNSLVTSNTITVSGITAATSISISGSGSPQFKVNTGAWTSTSTTVNNGDTVQIRGTTSGDFSTARLITLDIGGVTDQWSIKTQNIGGTVTAPSSGTISYNDVRACWGPASSIDVNMYDWRKNGPYWQDLPENASVPTGNPFTLSDFYGIKGIWELSNELPTVLSDADPVNGTASVSFLLQTTGPVELEYKVTVISGSTSGATFNLANPLNTWNSLGTWQISYTSADSSSVICTLRVHVRPVGSTQEVTQDISISLVIGLGS